MKKRLAKLLLLVAKRLDSQANRELVEPVDEYEAKKVGLTCVVTKKDIKDFRSKRDEKISLRKAKSGIVLETMKTIRKEIIDSVDANHLIEYTVREENGGYEISGELKVYVRTK